MDGGRNAAGSFKQCIASISSAAPTQPVLPPIPRRVSPTDDEIAAMQECFGFWSQQTVSIGNDSDSWHRIPLTLMERRHPGIRSRPFRTENLLPDIAMSSWYPLVWL